MKKSMLLIVAAVFALVALAGCPSAPPATTAVATATPPFVILQHKGTTLGIIDPPKWVAYAVEGPSKIEGLPEYADKYVVIVDNTGKDLTGLKEWSSSFEADREISKRLMTRVEAKFAGALVGDKDKVEGYMESVVKSTSEATFTGFKKDSDWWVQIRWFKEDGKTIDKEEFRYLVLFTIPKATLEAQLQKILDGSYEKAKTPEKAAAMDRVKEAFFTDF